jgi:hypothetical protein
VSGFGEGCGKRSADRVGAVVSLQSAKQMLAFGFGKLGEKDLNLEGRRFDGHLQWPAECRDVAKAENAHTAGSPFNGLA